MEEDFLYDSQLEEFLARFGEQKNSDPNKLAAMSMNDNNSALSSNVNKQPNNNKGLLGIKGNIFNKNKNKNNIEKGSNQSKFNEIGAKAGDIAGKVVSNVKNVTGLIDTLQGNNQETGALSGGPGDMLTAGLDGFSKGSEIGGQLGAGGAVVGGVLGAATGLVGRKKAMKKWQENIAKYNKAQDEKASNKLEQEFYQEEGLAQMNNLANIRKKQLGIMSQSM